MGSDASLVAERRWTFAMVSSMGGMLACASIASVGDVRNPPVIARRPSRCTLPRAADTFAGQRRDIALLVFREGAAQTSTSYSIFGRATALKSLRTWGGLIPGQSYTGAPRAVTGHICFLLTVCRVHSYLLNVEQKFCFRSNHFCCIRCTMVPPLYER